MPKMGTGRVARAQDLDRIVMISVTGTPLKVANAEN